MMRRFGTLIVVAMVLAGCGTQNPNDPVTYFDSNDPRMNAAMEKARSTVETFIAALKSPGPGRSGFSVKMPFADGDKVEHMWLTPVSYDGREFHGTVNNDPEAVKTVKIGSEVTVAPAKISDWMYVENRKLVGGYTLRVVRDGMTPAERAEFDRSVGFVVE